MDDRGMEKILMVVNASYMTLETPSGQNILRNIQIYNIQMKMKSGELQ